VTSDLGFGQKCQKVTFLVKWSKIDFWPHGFGGLVGGSMLVNAVFREHFVCVGVLGSCDGAGGVNAVFREHFMCVVMFGDPRIWVWSKMVKKSLLGSGNAAYSQNNDFWRDFLTIFDQTQILGSQTPQHT